MNVNEMKIIKYFNKEVNSSYHWRWEREKARQMFWADAVGGDLLYFGELWDP